MVCFDKHGSDHLSSTKGGKFCVVVKQWKFFKIAPAQLNKSAINKHQAHGGLQMPKTGLENVNRKMKDFFPFLHLPTALHIKSFPRS